MSVAINTWMFEFVTAFDGESCHDDYRWYLQQWLAAEQRGFTGLFLSEHHLVPGRYTPAPNLLLAAVATQTRNLRLGTMGNVVPRYDPWRLAAEYAMLDQLSGGRLEIGYASGSGPRFDEATALIDSLLNHERVDHSGRFWQYRGIGIAPRLQQVLPRRWMTGLSVASADMAAQRGEAADAHSLALRRMASLTHRSDDTPARRFPTRK
jgi:alkanesulfonate monooxygenase SsuD/methylene tetrahydromethanopterin reductase-like flavin-dependent oxidoreductase (luciferase family)